MEIQEGLAALEAVLFACGDSVTPDRLSSATGLEPEEVERCVTMLNERYQAQGSALQVLSLGGAYQLCTRLAYEGYIRAALSQRKNAPLSQAAMEALAVVAYNQPVTKSFVEHVRGVDSSSIVNSLAEKGLIEEAGRLDMPGRPIAYRTTDAFLRCFGLSSLADLPPVTQVQETPPGQLSMEDISLPPGSGEGNGEG